MDQVNLAVAHRTAFGSRTARRMRRDGQVPAIVYGSSHDPVPVVVNARELYAILHTEAGTNAVINLDVDGKEKVTAIAREIQRHPVRGDITHLDFIQIRLDEAIQAEVAIDFIGTPVGVREDGGIVETMSPTVNIEALPTEIPASIELDISHLEINDGLKVSDLPVIDGVEYLDEPDHPLVSVHMPRAEIEPEPIEGLEGEELEEGAEPAADGADDEAGESDEG